ncbi:hypothetical protein COCMIDRAFT_34443 [Bipolaris oryzae ATCC 44560]|uniref:Uncharacterized protein n=1 Tax=Bipolaris oryzae ATCC 44560 TaxID=930090 RepID=W6Z8I6_COCMI|nr:uncharacterized protein COCMIDRAFT_34443 [Bipolaris oryzae ATCC 44560]EUC48047.1 hypothetical protein COCMIDRAFT_34443 [Bipolaris oryzae ATCC 44560]
MSFFSGNETSGSHKSPTTHSPRPGLTRRDLFHSTPRSDSENDSDNINKLSKGVRNHGPLKQKATEAVRGQHEGKAPRKPLQKPGSLIIPFAKPAAIKFKPRLFPTTTWAPNSASKARSYNDLGSSSESTSAAPYDPLQDLSDNMDAVVKSVDEHALGGASVSVLKLVKYVKEWRGTVNKVVRAIQTAEDQRIKDLNAQLDFDREIEQVHQNTINNLLDEAWLAEVRKSEWEWQKKMDVQQQVINSQQQPNKALVQPCATDTQYPCSQDKTSSRIEEMNTPESTRAATTTQLETPHEDKVSLLIQKAKHLSNLGTQPYGVQKTKDDESGHKENAVTSMALNMALMQGGTHMSSHTIRSEPSSVTRADKTVTNNKRNNDHWPSATYSGDRISPGKHKLEDVHRATSTLENANWSRKRARTAVTR